MGEGNQSLKIQRSKTVGCKDIGGKEIRVCGKNSIPLPDPKVPLRVSQKVGPIGSAVLTFWQICRWEYLLKLTQQLENTKQNLLEDKLIVGKQHQQYLEQVYKIIFPFGLIIVDRKCLAMIA